MNKTIFSLLVTMAAMLGLLPASFASEQDDESHAFQKYLQTIEPAVASKVDAILGNWRAITPAVLEQPENREAIPVLRKVALSDQHIGATILMLNLGDEEIIALILEKFHGDSVSQRRNAFAVLERCSQPRIIPFLAADLYRDESTKTTYYAAGPFERTGVTPLSVQVGALIRAIIKNSSVFAADVKSWAAELERKRHNSRARDAIREALRTWWTENGDHIKSEKYDLVKAGPSVGALRTTSISCQDASAPYGGLVTLSATLTDSSLPDHPVIADKALGFAVNGKSISNPYEVWLAPGTHTVTVSFAGDSSYAASNATCHLTVQSTPGKITGGGSIGPGQRSFSFVTQTKSKGTAVSYTGNGTFRDASQNLDLKAGEITGMAVAADRVHGAFVAKATNNGASGFTMTIHLEDRAEPGVGADKFHLQVSGPNGFSYNSTGEGEGDGVLADGNLQIHKPQ